MNRSARSQKIFEMVLFSMLGCMTFCLQIAMEVFPNIHLTGMLIILFTVVFRKKALIPLYLYVFLTGIRFGFSLSWIPYLYVWIILWAMTMLIPKKLSPKAAFFLYPAVGFLHGLSYGVLYAPAQAILFGLDFRGTLAWIAAGFPWDVTHAIGNGFFCLLVLPLSELMKRLLK